MATEIGNKLNLIDVAKMLDPSGGILPVAAVLNESNPIIEDIPWIEGNLPTGHRIGVDTSLPSGTYRKLNSGVLTSKATTGQVDETCGMLDAYCEVDKKLADLNGNTAAFRAHQDKKHLEGLSQDFADTLFYGNAATAPEEFNGLSVRTSSLGTYVLGGGGTDDGTDCTSIFLVGWGPIYGIFPKASKAGLAMEDKGQVTLGDATNGYYEGYRTHYVWEHGLAVEDARYLVRLANIEGSSLATYGASSDSYINLIQYMIQMQNLLPNQNACRPVFYVSRTVKTWLDIMIEDKHNVYLTLNDYAGRATTFVRGIPVKQCDSIVSTESQVS
jgi:hypothetical protein